MSMNCQTFLIYFVEFCSYLYIYPKCFQQCSKFREISDCAQGDGEFNLVATHYNSLTIHLT